MTVFLPEGYGGQTPAAACCPTTPEGWREAAARETVLWADAALCDTAHNLWVTLPGLRGMIPREEGALGIAEGTLRDIALIARVGHPVCFTVMRMTHDADGRPLAILSRRRAQELCRRQYLDLLRPGDVIPVRITRLESFGAFCDVGCGISSLIPIDRISVSRIFHPGDRFTVGQDLKAVVHFRDDRGRLHLTHKELLGTWEENAADFTPGETVTGRVRTVESYGSFIELTPNLAGLAEPCPGVTAGLQATVFIKSILPEKMKVKLIVVDTCPARGPLSSGMRFWGDHMDFWQYSPPGAVKNVFTDFTAPPEE